MSNAFATLHATRVCKAAAVFLHFASFGGTISTTGHLSLSHAHTFSPSTWLGSERIFQILAQND
jgi:hypothetical protein